MAKSRSVAVGKAEVTIDLTGIESRRKRRVVIPEGMYHAKVVSATGKKFNTGTRGVEWVFEVFGAGPEADGTRFWYRNVLQNEDGSVAEKSLWSFRGVLAALKPAIKIPDKALKIPLDKLVGRTLALDIVDSVDNEDKPRSDISDVFSEDQLEAELAEEEDDEEEEEEDEEESEEEDSDDEAEFDLDEDEL